MSKPDLYVSSRVGGRLSRADAERVEQTFTSTGRYQGPADAIAHVMNFCLEKRLAFRHLPTGTVGALASVERVLP